MEIVVQREELVAELALLQGIVERRATIPVLSHILLQAHDDRLDLAATDLDVSLSTSCEAEVKKSGALAVQAKKFTEIVRALGAPEVKLTLAEGQNLTIESGRSRFRIRGLEADTFPTLPKVEAETEVELSLASLQQMISKVIFAISTEESRFQLNGALLKVGPEVMEMVATDGHRLALVSLDREGESVPGLMSGVLVPRKALQELSRFSADESVFYRRSEHHLSFRVGKRELTSRILEGTFPDYERVIARDNDRKPVLDRKALQQAVQRVSLLSGERARGVRFNFEADQLTLSAANPDLGEAEEKLACRFEGESVQIGLNPDYVGHFLAAVEDEEVRLELKDAESQCVGFPVSDGELRYLCVIMPMHV
jgi:DNA polymerase-3 subunit beta